MALPNFEHIYDLTAKLQLEKDNITDILNETRKWDGSEAADMLEKVFLRELDKVILKKEKITDDIDVDDIEVDADREVAHAIQLSREPRPGEINFIDLNVVPGKKVSNAMGIECPAYVRIRR